MRDLFVQVPVKEGSRVGASGGQSGPGAVPSLPGIGFSAHSVTVKLENQPSGAGRKKPVWYAVPFGRSWLR